MKINYLSLVNDTPAEGYWDHALLKDLLEDLPDSEREVFIIPGAYQGNAIKDINMYLAAYPKVLVFITSDEEGKFLCQDLKHPDMILYCQYGTCKNSNIFPIGYTSETRKHLKSIGFVKKDISVFFAGQLNSDERRAMFLGLVDIPKSVLFGTDGFSRGLKPEEYYDYMAHAKYAPAPGGHVSPDSFRFYEALEARVIPIRYPEYLDNLFPDMPKLVGDKDITNSVFAWWIKKKVELKQQIKKDLGIQEALTVIIPTSPIPSHPSTEIIDQTIKSVRFHTNSDIILTIDGIRPEQENMQEQYEEYIRQLLWKCNFEYTNIMPVIFNEHKHQSGMMKETLPLVKTPLLLYVEHDTPLVTDMPIDWQYLIQIILDQKAHVIRFHYESFVPKEHEYLMVGKPEGDLLKTVQWSQRPHLARTEFYKDAMRFFSEDANCFIEDLLYGKLLAAVQVEGVGNWQDWKVFIYHPEGDIKRSLNLDGRGTDKKYEKEQIW